MLQDIDDHFSEHAIEVMDKIKAQYAPQYASEEERKFMTRKTSPLVKKYALLMYHMAPKTCDKCDTDLRVPELCWREEQNVSDFLCYKCISSLEKEGAMLVQDGRGRWELKTK